MYAYYS